MSEPVETGWLIEHGKSPVSRPLYAALSSSRLEPIEWTHDHIKALRFGRKQDATLFAHQYLELEAVRICDHQWVPS